MRNEENISCIVRGKRAITCWQQGSKRIGGLKMFFFRKIWHALFSRNTRFEIRPFALLPTNYHIVHMLNIFMLIHQ